MNEMRKLLNLMESAMAEGGPPQSGTREFENMRRALAELGKTRHIVSDIYNRFPRLRPDEQVAVLDGIRERLEWPMSILEGMEIDDSGWEFRLANQSWGILAAKNANFEDLVNNTDSKRIQGMLKLMDKDLANLVNKLNPIANAGTFIK